MKTLAELEVMRKVCSHQCSGLDKYRRKPVPDTYQELIEYEKLTKWLSRLIKIEAKMVEIVEIEADKL